MEALLQLQKEEEGAEAPAGARAGGSTCARLDTLAGQPGVGPAPIHSHASPVPRRRPRRRRQPVRSFKVRGAYNKMSRLTPEQLKKGVICSSAGNHAQVGGVGCVWVGKGVCVCVEGVGTADGR